MVPTKKTKNMELLLSAQHPVSGGGLAAYSLYIHSEFPFPSRRLHRLSQSFRFSHFRPDGTCDRIFVHTAHHLLDVLSEASTLIANPPTPFPVRPIVIESIAALFRSELDNNPRDLKRRSSLFFKISGVLKALAVRFAAVVVVTNQVVDVIESSDLRIGNSGCLYSSGRRVCPALGISWANCLNSRLFLSRRDGAVGEEGSGIVDENDNVDLRRQKLRHLHVVFAPHLPYSCCEFVIVREGGFGVET